MGFASKIAASQQSANSGVYGGAPPPGYTGGPPSLQPGQKPGGYQPQYQAYPGSPPPSTPQSLRPASAQSPYPTSPAQQYQPYSQPPPAGRATEQQIASYRQLLISTIQEKNLQNFYPPARLEQVLQGLANDAPAKVAKLMREWNVGIEIAMDVMKLSLFDIILYVDDSGSIEFEENGIRKEQLKQILGIVATAASTFDQDGISVRFMNSMEVGDGIRNAEDVNRLVPRVRFAGLTPLGTNLRNKVLDPMVVGPARANRLQKPVLIITITDGQPAGEPHDTVAQAIRYASDEVSRTQYGRGAVAFQFSQVGNDTKARDFLASLDEDPVIGGLVDCTSNFEVEQDEMSRANPPVHLTRELWCAKLMLGSIDSSYDTKDEKAAGRAGGAPPPPQQPGQYGGYNQAPGYNPPGNYSQPPPPPQQPGQYGGYNQAPGYNQPGDYNRPPPLPQQPGQYNQPPPNYGQPTQRGYGQQYTGYGYPPQQQNPYGQPPPPPRY